MIICRTLNRDLQVDKSEWVKQHNWILFNIFIYALSQSLILMKQVT